MVLSPMEQLVITLLLPMLTCSPILLFEMVTPGSMSDPDPIADTPVIVMCWVRVQPGDTVADGVTVMLSGLYMVSVNVFQAMGLLLASQVSQNLRFMGPVVAIFLFLAFFCSLLLQLASSKSTWARAKNVLLGKGDATKIPEVPCNGDINP